MLDVDATVVAVVVVVDDVVDVDIVVEVDGSESVATSAAPSPQATAIKASTPRIAARHNRMPAT